MQNRRSLYISMMMRMRSGMCMVRCASFKGSPCSISE